MFFAIVYILPLFALTHGDMIPIIVGGNEVSIKEHRHQVAILVYEGKEVTALCGGSLISDKFVVSAAHCTRYPTFVIRLGSNRADEGGIVVNVTKVVPHPSYKKETKNYDVAIFELAHPVKFSDTINAIPLPSATERLDDGTIVTVTGYGATYPNGPSSKKLLGVEVETVSNVQCQKAHSRKITEVMLCALVAGGGKDACQGDSGGPLTANNKLFGIVSWGTGCAEPNIPGVYTYVPFVRDFIKQITGI